ncbi:hypothetical protein [Actinacidiphila sp. bgisy145]|uniref:hypothetical protein n=1 Tax=Actinacidiphila sp. bgisy145 TaxID=3413792 RepID=UPI003EB9D262
MEGDVADVDASVARDGEEADETAAVEDVELAEAAFPVEGAADFRGAFAERGELGGEALDLGDDAGRQSGGQMVGARVVVPGPLVDRPVSASASSRMRRISEMASVGSFVPASTRCSSDVSGGLSALPAKCPRQDLNLRTRLRSD